MARILCKERVVEYSVDFKIKVVQLTDQLDVNAMQIAEVLDLHPVMVYRWRQEYREGKFIASPTRKISMTKEQPEQAQSNEERFIATPLYLCFQNGMLSMNQPHNNPIKNGRYVPVQYSGLELNYRHE